MKKFLLTGLFALIATLPASAQFSRINNITLENGNNTQAAFYASPFTLKVGAACTWSISGTIATINCAGGGGSPASPSGSLQYNNSGSLGAVPILKAGIAGDCDGSGNPCALQFANVDTFGYIIFGTDPMQPMGNSFQFDYGSGTWELINDDGTYVSSLAVAAGSGSTLLTQGGALGTSGLKIESSNRLVSIGRIQFDISQYATPVTATNFTLGAGWGSTASATGSGGSDNLFVFFVTAGGSGIASSPTFTFTYGDGDMSTGSALVSYVCTQTGGNDTVVPSGSVITTTRNQTNEIFTWTGLPTTGKTYEITCFGGASN